MHTGQNVKERRIELSMSQTQLADKSGIQQTTISAIERGTDPTGQTLKRLAAALKTTTDDLLKEEVSK